MEWLETWAGRDSVHARVGDDVVRAGLTALGFVAGDDGTVRLAVSAAGDALERVAATWAEHGVEAARQAAGADPVPWDAALEAFICCVEPLGVSWYLIGTGALGVQGFDIEPKDIDVFVDPADADRVFAAFGDSVLAPLADSTGWVCARFGRLFLGALVEVAVDAAPSVDVPHPRPWGPIGRERLHVVEWRGRSIRVPDLGLHLDDEQRRGRQHYVDQLRARLGRNRR